MKIQASYPPKANWKEINVNASIPAKLEKLNELAHNMWWSWNHSARDLFDSIDTAAWLESGKNPVLMLSRLSYEKLEEMANDQLLMSKMDKVFDEFKA